MRHGPAPTDRRGVDRSTAPGRLWRRDHLLRISVRSPLLPGYLSLMSGYSIAELETGAAATGRMLRATGLFVAGFTAVFVALGAGATAIGSALRANLDLAERVAGWVVVGFGVLLLVMSLSNSPRLSGLTRERRIDVRPSRLGMWLPR